MMGPSIPDSTRRTIIATKGLPCTGKSSIAEAVAWWYGCPFLRLDDVLKWMWSDSTRRPSTQEKTRLVDLAMNIISSMASTVLWQQDKLPFIVLDLPLPSQSQFERLVQGALDISVEHVLVIECNQMHTYSYEMRMEEHLKKTTGEQSCWHKPKSWDEVKSMMMGQEDYQLIASRFDDVRGKTCFLSRLGIDAFNDVEHKVLNSRKNVGSAPSFFEALDYVLLTHNLEVYGPCSMNMQRWREMKYNSSCDREFSSSTSLCAKGIASHDLTNFTTILGDEDEEAECGVCENPITGPAYSCRTCLLALHKDCAELNLDRASLKHLPSKINQVLGTAINYPHNKSCQSCRNEGKRYYSTDCKSCVFERFLKCPVAPTVIRHPLHPAHFLSMHILDPFVTYSCSACGVRTFERVIYCCKICHKFYAVSCVAELPHEPMIEHVGYQHPLKLKSLEGSDDDREEELEDYLCCICWDKRDPTLWYYYCHDCDFSAHIECMIPKHGSRDHYIQGHKNRTIGW